MQKSPDFVGQDRACSIFDDSVGRLFVYRTTNFVYVAMVIVYNERWIFYLCQGGYVFAGFCLSVG